MAVRVYKSSGTGLSRIYYDKQISTESQTDFVLSFQYIVNSNRLLVFVNGILQAVNSDYTEVDNVTVRFTNPLPAGEEVQFIYFA